MTLEEKIKELENIHPNLFTTHKGLKQEFLSICQEAVDEAKTEGEIKGLKWCLGFDLDNVDEKLLRRKIKELKEKL